jgi:hypothetical protein
MRDECDTCGAGRKITEATFDLGRELVRWTMWSCGHSARAVDDVEPAPA